MFQPIPDSEIEAIVYGHIAREVCDKDQGIAIGLHLRGASNKRIARRLGIDADAAELLVDQAIAAVNAKLAELREAEAIRREDALAESLKTT